MRSGTGHGPRSLSLVGGRGSGEPIVEARDRFGGAREESCASSRVTPAEWGATGPSPGPVEASSPPVAGKPRRAGGHVWTSERSWTRKSARRAWSSADSAARFLKDCSLKFLWLLGGWASEEGKPGDHAGLGETPRELGTKASDVTGR